MRAAEAPDSDRGGENDVNDSVVAIDTKISEVFYAYVGTEVEGLTVSDYHYNSISVCVPNGSGEICGGRKGVRSGSARWSMERCTGLRKKRNDGGSVGKNDE